MRDELSELLEVLDDRERKIIFGRFDGTAANLKLSKKLERHSE
jgi:hypothetical protein